MRAAHFGPSGRLCGDALRVAVSLLALAATPAAATPTGAELARERMRELESFFAGHPELQQPRGSMWKHFVANRWFLDNRTVNGVLPTAADRMLAWEEREARLPLAANRDAGWFAIGPPNVSGRIVDLKFHPTDPRKVYAAAASGGVWISEDGGSTWRTTTDGLPSLAIGAVCVLPTNPDVVLAATGEGLNWSYVVFGVGIWKSTDGGETWAPTSLTHEITDNHGFHAMEANPITGTVLACANDGLWRSIDEGDTWSRVRSDGEYYDAKWQPGSATRVFAAKGNAASTNGIKVSNDDGLGWAAAGTGQPASSSISKTRLAVTPADPNAIYAHYGDKNSYGTLGIYRSLDGGTTWQARNTSLNISGGQGGYAVTIAVDPADPQRVIAGGIRVYLSTDGGVNFAETGPGNPLGDETAVHWDHHAVAWEPGSTENLWVGTDGGPWRSTDSGATWSPRRDGLITTQYYDVCLDPGSPEFRMGGSQDNGLTWVEEADSSWYPSTLIADGFACYVEPTMPERIHSEWQFGGHVRSDDRGQSWQVTTAGLAGASLPFAPLALDVNRPGYLWTSTSSGIYRTVNGQDFWTWVDSHQATWIAVSPLLGSVIWTVNGNTGGVPVRCSSNDGANWLAAAAYGFAVGNETKILSHPDNVATAFVTFAGYGGMAHVARTTNYGASWQDVSGDFPPEPANVMAIDPDHPEHWFVGTDSGVWFSENDGANWLPLGTGFPNVVVYDLEIQQAARKLVVTTYGRGTWETDLPQPTGFAGTLEPHAPNLLLDPPSPNPAAARVLFRFASRRAGRATLDLYDVRGRLVENVAELGGGDGIIRSVEWSPERLAAGVYFAVLRAGDEMASRKLVVAR